MTKMATDSPGGEFGPLLLLFWWPDPEGPNAALPRALKVPPYYDPEATFYPETTFFLVCSRELGPAPRPIRPTPHSSHDDAQVGHIFGYSTHPSVRQHPSTEWLVFGPKGGGGGACHGSGRPSWHLYSRPQERPPLLDALRSCFRCNCCLLLLFFCRLLCNSQPLDPTY